MRERDEDLGGVRDAVAAAGVADAARFRHQLRQRCPENFERIGEGGGDHRRVGYASTGGVARRCPHLILNNATLESVRECHCRLCGRLPATDPLAGHVARRGWDVVLSPAEGHRTASAFTVGLWHSFAHAEASVFGRKNEDEMIRWLETVGAEVKTSQCSSAGWVSDVVGTTGVFPRPALGQLAPARFWRRADLLPGPPVPMLQLVWPDRDGVLPCGEGCADDCLAAQPRLWDHVKPGPSRMAGHSLSRPTPLVLTTKAIAFDGRTP